jgi:hypothetical protein
MSAAQRPLLSDLNVAAPKFPEKHQFYMAFPTYERHHGEYATVEHKVRPYRTKIDSHCVQDHRSCLRRDCHSLANLSLDAVLRLILASPAR